MSAHEAVSQDVDVSDVDVAYLPSAEVVEATIGIHPPRKGCCGHIITRLLRSGHPPAYNFETAVAHRASTCLQTFALRAIGLLPTILIVILIEVAHKTIVAMFVFHWAAAVVIPACYLIVDSDSCSEPWRFIRRQFSGYAVRRGQCLTAGTLVAILTPPGGLGVWALSQWCWLVWQLYVPVRHNMVRYGVSFSVPTVVAFVIYFTFVNSLIEELFWRGFLLERLGSSRRAVLFASCACAFSEPNPCAATLSGAAA